MYTLLGTSVLGFDLVRRPGGADVAAVLVDALALGADDLPVLAAARPSPLLSASDRASVVHVTEGSPLSSALGEMSRLVAAGRVSDALALIERAPMAGLDDLLRCVRTDVLDWAWTATREGTPDRDTAEAAVAVVCDAVTAAYHVEQLRPGLRAQLAEPWVRSAPLLGSAGVDGGPCQVEVEALLQRLATVDEQARTRLLETGARLRAAGGWASSMHSATWAVHLTGRVRAAAAAQLRAVGVLAATGLSVTDAAAGIWNLVSGAVQAAVVNDLLDDDSHERLLAPVIDALDRHG